MNYSQFIIKMKECLQENLGAEASVENISVQKNNGVRLQGITIRKKGERVVPTIYLERFYEDYLEGREMEDILEEFLDVYEQHDISFTPDFDFFRNYEEVRKHLGLKLVDKERNVSMLADMPYVSFLNLAVIFYCLVDSPVTGTATILIKNAHLDHWKVTIDTLYQDALYNAESMLPGEIKTMEEVISGLISEEDLSRENQERGRRDFPKLEGFTEKKQKKISGHLPLLVLTNSRKYFGASCILYENLLKKFAESSGQGFYILPSSVHEVILLPENYVERPERLLKLVSEVNKTQLDPEDVLSDSVYYFQKETGRIIVYAVK